MQRAIDYKGSLNQFLQQYNYQPSLTKRLDSIGKTPFSQLLLNEIVLWKVNRYVAISQEVLKDLDALTDLANGQHRQAQNALENLLKIHGVDLPMASTILRFRNSNVFQIIDKHAYRAVYGKRYPLYTASPTSRKIAVYFDYLDELIELCAKRNLKFQLIDRTLYQFDKRVNERL